MLKREMSGITTTRLITDSLCYHYPLSNKLFNYDVLSYTLNIEEKKTGFVYLRP